MKGFFYACLFLSMHSLAQDKAAVSLFNQLGTREGQAYVYWGYNRAFYDESDIHFKGKDFNFTLHDVDAEDMPEPFDPRVYLNFNQFSIPQFNFRAGYFFKNNTAISLGWDHMKYHAITTQLVRITGTIDGVYSPGDELTDKELDRYILYNPNFMDYHHSDGFNFVRLGIDQRLPVWKSQNNKHVLSLNGAANVGITLPWTDWTFFRTHYRNKLHIAGAAMSLSFGARIELFKYFFIQGNIQAGRAFMPDIVLQDDLDSRASQNINFFERSWAIGAYVPLVKQR